jgi:predicted DNA-binding protein
MATISLKLSEEQTRKLNRSARAVGQSKSAYIRSLLDGRIETAGDLLGAWERGEVPGPRRPRRRRAVA